MREELLYEQVRALIGVPRSKVSMWVCDHNGHHTLLVRIDPEYWHRAAAVPSYLDGRMVIVEQRTPATIQNEKMLD